MLNQSRLNIFLFTLLIVMAGTTLTIEYIGQNSTIIHLSENQISHIVIETSDRPGMRLEKSGNEWIVLDKTQSLKANSSKVKLLLELATTKSIEKFDAVDTELFKYELAPPHLTVYLNDQAVHFGGLEPINQLRYVQINNTVHLIKDEYYRYLLADKQFFIES